jgi:hypothetical protein
MQKQIITLLLVGVHKNKESTKTESRHGELEVLSNLTLFAIGIFFFLATLVICSYREQATPTLQS